jgi:hypothetical protein
MLKSFQRIWPEYDITAHGFRATYRTIAHEHLGIDQSCSNCRYPPNARCAWGCVCARNCWYSAGRRLNNGLTI